MGRREFRAMVLEDGEGVLAWTLDAASSYFIQNGRTGREDVDECVRLARFLADRQHAAYAAMGLSPTPGLAITSAELLDRIQPMVEALRQTLFGRSTVPFRSSDSAASWTEKHAATPRRLSRRQQKEAEDLHVDIELKSQRLSELLGHAITCSEEVHSLPYRGADKRVARVNVIPGSKLAALEERSRYLAIATGFPQEAIVNYILTGASLSLPPMKLTRTYRRLGETGTPPKSVILETFARDVTSAGVRSVHAQIRKTLNVKRVKRLTRDQEELSRLVTQAKHERPPQGRETNRGFWERVRAKWNERHRERPYQTWRGPEMRYRRLRKTAEAAAGRLPDSQQTRETASGSSRSPTKTQSV